MSWTSAPRRTSAASRSTSGRIGGRALRVREHHAVAGGPQPVGDQLDEVPRGHEGALEQHPVAAAQADRPQRLRAQLRRPLRGELAAAGDLHADAGARQLGPERRDAARYLERVDGVLRRDVRRGDQHLGARALRRPCQRDRPGEVRGPVVEAGEHVRVQVDHAAQAMAAARRGPWSRTLCPAWIALPIAPAACGRGRTCCCRRCWPRCSRSARGASSRTRRARRRSSCCCSPSAGSRSPTARSRAGARRSPSAPARGACSRRGRSSRRSGPTRRCGRWSSSTASSCTR